MAENYSENCRQMANWTWHYLILLVYIFCSGLMQCNLPILSIILALLHLGPEPDILRQLIQRPCAPACRDGDDSHRSYCVYNDAG